MKFARYTFLIAGIYGLLVLVPQYFVEAGGTPVTGKPEFFYGFIGVAVAFQLVFLLIAADPQKYRAMILPSIVEKFSFAIAVAILVYAGRTSGQIVIGAALDLLLGVLFIVSWFKFSTAPKADNG
ncbi:MAG: hypothetical protein AB7F88_06205 [Pyrinomonadaceae bacterium]